MNEKVLSWLGETGIPVWVIVPLAWVLWIFIGWTIKKVVFAWLHRLSSRTSTDFDDILIAAADWPVTILIFTSGVAAVFHAAFPQAPKDWTVIVGNVAKVATIVAIALFVDRLFGSFLFRYSKKLEVLQTSYAFTSVLVHVMVVGIAGLVTLDSMGISITPIIASLGIGSLAVALALQPTLENLFSGFQIIVDQPVRPGQYVKLESGEEGYVERTGWRTTWIRMLSNNMVIIPNKQLVNARVTNFYYPTKDLAVLVEVGVHYHSDLEKVERVAIEVASDVMKKTPGAFTEFKPFIRYHTLGESSINFSVILRGNEFTDTFLIKHEFVKALAKRFASEGIIIPYPTRTINLNRDKGAISGPVL